MKEIVLDKEGKFKLVAKKDNSLAVDKDVIYLFEWDNYQIVGEINSEVDIYLGDEIIEDRLFSVKNYIGFTILRIVDGDRNLAFRKVRVLSKKIPKIINKEAKSIEDFVKLNDEFCDAIVEDIIEKCIDLPFSVYSPTGFEFVELDESVSVLFAYHFLKNNTYRIISAYESIRKFPHRKLVDDFELVDFHEVTDVDEDTVLDIVFHPERLIETSNRILMIDRKSYAPMKVLQKKRYETFDTLENRFAKYFLSELLIWSERVLEELGDKMSYENREKIDNLHATLECFWNDPIFSEAGELTMFPYTSQVLLRKEGYRDLLELWREFRAYSPFFGELERAIANKDIPKLYEYWCFFRLVEELKDIFGKCELRIVIEPSGELSEGEVYAEFENGWRLYYNKLLREESYSVPLRPDFSLFDRNGLVGVFDAKFKLDIVDRDKFAEEDKKMECKPSFQTWAKIEDIYKMHTYRDALKTKFAVVLYPGNESSFFKIDGERIKNFDLKELLNKEGVKLEGVGYLGFKPILNHKLEHIP